LFSLEEAVHDYVVQYLKPDHRLGAWLHIQFPIFFASFIRSIKGVGLARFFFFDGT
jgi:hypothetical protein